MTTRKLFEKKIISNTNIPNKDGYVWNNTENLIAGIDKDLFLDDLIQGSGNELKSKFNAIYSSCALGVNNFGFVKKHLSDFTFLEYSGFTQGNFERQFRTGLGGTPPNLDFVLENEETVIAFESKYLEPLRVTKVDFKDSYNKERLSYLDNFWFDLINEYQGEKFHLDVAQLIKHSIGLVNYKERTNKNLVLVYIYWLPDTFDRYPEYIEHEKELKDFSEKIRFCPDLKFIHLSYNQFWDSYNNTPVFKEHFDSVKKRYKMEI